MPLFKLIEKKSIYHCSNDPFFCEKDSISEHVLSKHDSYDEAMEDYLLRRACGKIHKNISSSTGEVIFEYFIESNCKDFTYKNNEENTWVPPTKEEETALKQAREFLVYLQETTGVNLNCKFKPETERKEATKE